MSRCSDLGEAGRVFSRGHPHSKSHHVELGYHARARLSCPMGRLDRSAVTPPMGRADARVADGARSRSSAENTTSSCVSQPRHLFRPICIGRRRRRGHASRAVSCVVRLDCPQSWCALFRSCRRHERVPKDSIRVVVVDLDGFVDGPRRDHEWCTPCWTGRDDRPLLSLGVRRFPLIPDGNRFPASRPRLSARDMSAIRIVFSRNARSERPGPLPHRSVAIGVVSRRGPLPRETADDVPRGVCRLGSSAPLAPPKRAQDRFPSSPIAPEFVIEMTRPVAPPRLRSLSRSLLRWAREWRVGFERSSRHARRPRPESRRPRYARCTRGRIEHAEIYTRFRTSPRAASRGPRDLRCRRAA